MTRRITGDDLLKFAAGHYPEPYPPAMGQRHHYGILSRLVNQVTALGAARDQLRKERHLASATTIEAVMEGIYVSLGEVLADRTKDTPVISDSPDDMTNDQWSRLMSYRTENYLEWLQPLLEPATVVIDEGIKRGEA